MPGIGKAAAVSMVAFGAMMGLGGSMPTMLGGHSNSGSQSSNSYMTASNNDSTNYNKQLYVLDASYFKTDVLFVANAKSSSSSDNGSSDSFGNHGRNGDSSMTKSSQDQAIEMQQEYKMSIESAKMSVIQASESYDATHQSDDQSGSSDSSNHNNNGKSNNSSDNNSSNNDSSRSSGSKTSEMVNIETASAKVDEISSANSTSSSNDNSSNGNYGGHARNGGGYYDNQSNNNQMNNNDYSYKASTESMKLAEYKTSETYATSDSSDSSNNESNKSSYGNNSDHGNYDHGDHGDKGGKNNDRHGKQHVYQHNGCDYQKSHDNCED